MQYCYKCKACGAVYTEGYGAQEAPCPACGAASVVRDWRTELGTKQFHIPLHMSSKNTTSKSDFLPDAKFFEGPDDPSGERHMKDWKENHTLKGHKELI